ncbi:MAG: hypothetical protein HY754_08775 [Nitrospirae bacterium]|nr:hypothetical protein [Nitrospirota bacterium]
MKILFRNPIFHLFLIAIVGLLVYSNTFYVPFQFDDRPNIVENYRLKDLSRFWPPEGSRWLGFLTFAFNYHIGGLNVTGYHIFNLHLEKGYFTCNFLLSLIACNVYQIQDTRYKKDSRCRIHDTR